MDRWKEQVASARLSYRRAFVCSVVLLFAHHTVHSAVYSARHGFGGVNFPLRVILIMQTIISGEKIPVLQTYDGLAAHQIYRHFY